MDLKQRVEVPKSSIEGTIFEDYDTVIFDLDATIWDVVSATGEGLGAYQMVPPLRQDYPMVVFDSHGNVAKLQKGVVQLFRALNDAGKNIGAVSSGEDEDRPFQAQPATMLLKQFRLYSLINLDIVLKKDADKKLYVKPHGKTLFIDDKKENVDEVNAYGRVDVLWRGAFQTWDQLLVPKSQQLNFNAYPDGSQVQ